MINSKNVDPHRYTAIPKDENNVPENYGYGFRHVQMFLLFISFGVGYMVKAHLSVTIVAMTQKQTFVDVTNGTRVYSNYKYFQNNSTELSNKLTGLYKTYDWPKSTQEIILSSFGLGYGLMTFPMSFVTQRWGGVVSLQIVFLFDGLASIFVPWLAAWGGWCGVAISHVIQGLAQGGIMSAVYRLFGNWLPLCERARLSSYVCTGITFGTIVGLQISGVLAEAWGWASTYWVIGGICLAVFILLTFFLVDSPSVHKHISREEKIFITGANVSNRKKILKTPWIAILRSKPCWAACISHVGSIVTFMFCLIQVPTYLHHVLGVNVKNSGFLSSLPYVANVIASIGFGILSDYCTNRKWLSIKSARCISNAISCLSMTMCLVAVSFTRNVALAITCFVIAMFGHAAIHTGSMLTYIDLSPNYCGVLAAAGSTLMSASMLAMPVLVSQVITKLNDQFQLRIVFLVVAAISLVSNVIYLTFMSAEVQPWNECEHTDKGDKEDGEQCNEYFTKEQRLRPNSESENKL